MSNYIGYENRVKYELYNENFGIAEILEPIGWNEDEKELKRSDDLFGVFTSLSNNLQFIDGGLDYILAVYDKYGIEDDILLTKYRKHPQTDEWETIYEGYLDMTTISTEDDKLSVKFNESGFYKKIQARQDVDFEMDRSDTADGVEMTPMRIDKVDLPSRKIKYISSSFQEKPSTTGDMYTVRCYSSHKTERSWVSPKTTIELASHEDFSAVTEVDGNPSSLSSPNFFFTESNRARTIKFELDMDMVIGEYDPEQPLFSDLKRIDEYRLTLVKFLHPTDFSQYEEILLKTVSTGESLETTITYKTPAPIDVDLEVGESLAVMIRLWNVNPDIDYYTTILTFRSISKFNIKIEEDTLYTDSSYLNYKVLLPHETGERLVNIMTNRVGAFKSDFLGREDIGYDGDGDGAFVGITNGFWIRGFENSDDKRFPLTTSFKDFRNSFSSVFALGMGIERLDGVNKVVIEPIDYFFGENVTIVLPNKVDNIKRSVEQKFYFSSINIGYDFDGEYEKVNGLDEYNIKNRYTTHITKTENKFEAISKYRADSYGIEFARRLPAARTGTEDSPYDDKIFLLDMKKTSTPIFKMNIGADGLSQLATGVYSPETAQNLRLSPMNNMVRWGSWIKTGLEKYLDKFIRYSSTKGNSSLQTQLIGGNLLKENGILLTSELERSLADPIWIEFEYPVDDTLLKTIFGSTDGKPNYYGLVEFTNEDDEKEYGFLWDVKPNGNGQWKLLKANITII